MKCRLSILMGKERYTIQDVHRLTGLSRVTISKLYNDTATRYDCETLEKICDLFKCEISELIELEGIKVKEC